MNAPVIQFERMLNRLFELQDDLGELNRLNLEAMEGSAPDISKGVDK